ncbi:hypothetical protein [Gimesia aquarii]|uniref:Uncharacterized protein n=1 Tax=Gimesia aquarii TaxID=2527964 RepID=A0A517VRC1_9PLAN|nr:hypothetical protein [Gimesia aquarii]QDT95547.1 hypothetical protein V144x_09920 [Gimesia aquarii]
MAALTQDTTWIESRGEEADFPVAATTNIYQGSVVGLNASGYARPFVIGDKFAGITLEGRNNNSSVDGDLNVCCKRGKFYLEVALAGVALSDAVIEASVYAQDSGTLSLRSGFKVGKVVAYLRSGVALVLFETNPQFHVLSETVAFGDFTDVDASGYIDLSTPIPEGSVVLGWQADVKTGFTGNTTAVVQVGESGNVDRFSAKLDSSCVAADVVGSAPPSVAANQGYLAAAVTPRVTVTGGTDFTAISAGEMDIKIIYLPALRV